MDYLVLLSSIAIGAVAVFWFQLANPKRIKLLNAFTGAYLLTLTMLHLLPDLYEVHEGVVPKPLIIGACILAGFFVQIALDAISLGVEHGHSHHLHGRMPVGVVLGLCLHAFVEALALGDASSRHTAHELATRHFLLISIVVHNFPVSIALLGMLLHCGMKRSSALALLGLFAAMAPLGMFVGGHTALANYSRELMAVVIGIFMHIATTILFESSDVHRFPLGKLTAVVLGLALGIASVMFH